MNSCLFVQDWELFYDEQSKMIDIMLKNYKIGPRKLYSTIAKNKILQFMQINPQINTTINNTERVATINNAEQIALIEDFPRDSDKLLSKLLNTNDFRRSSDLFRNSKYNTTPISLPPAPDITFGMQVKAKFANETLLLSGFRSPPKVDCKQQTENNSDDWISKYSTFCIEESDDHYWGVPNNPKDNFIHEILIVNGSRLGWISTKRDNLSGLFEEEPRLLK